MRKNYILAFVVLISTEFVQTHSDVISMPIPSVFVVEETKKWFCGTPEFQNCSTNEEVSKSIEDLLSWKTPDYIVKHFPYYLAGVSYDELPIYIGECGKYDVVALLRQGPEVVENIDKAIAQVIVRALATMEKGGLDGSNHNVYAILDFEGFEFSNFASSTALELMMRIALQYRILADHFAQNVYLINGNYAMDTLYKIFRPVLGRLNERIEVYGSKKSKWKAALRREFPLESLPPWYGGYGNFTPIATYG